jgi:ketosteroid isomerase-like protein
MKLLMSLVLAGTCALATATDSLAEWQSRYQIYGKLIDAKDRKGYLAIYTDDYIWVDPKGKKKNKKQMAVELEELFNAKKVVIKGRVTKVVTKNGVTQVDFDFHFTVDTGKQGVMLMHEVGTDSWRKENGKWLEFKTVDKVLTQSQLKPSKGKISQKPG